MQQKTGPLLEVEEVTTTEALEQLRPEWVALWARCPTATPFQAPEWLIPWWRHIGEGELWTLALRHAGRLVGLAPLYIYVKPGAARREVFLVGIATTDYLDALFEPEFASCGVATVLAHLEAASARWDVCDWQQLRSRSPLLTTALPARWQEAVSMQDACPVLRLPATVEALTGHVSPRLRKSLRYCWRRAAHSGPLRVESARPDNLNELLEALLRLHGARWSARGLAGVLAPEGVQKAHQETAPALFQHGMLRLYGLRLAERIVASFYGFTHTQAGTRRAYFYLGGFDPALAHLSPGLLVLDHAIREAIGEGAVEFDFLRGREAYKYRWGAQDHPTFRRQLWLR